MAGFEFGTLKRSSPFMALMRPVSKRLQHLYMLESHVVAKADDGKRLVVAGRSRRHPKLRHLSSS